MGNEVLGILTVRQNCWDKVAGVHQFITVISFLVVINPVLFIRIQPGEIKAGVRGVWMIQQLEAAGDCLILMGIDNLPADDIPLTLKWTAETIKFAKLKEVAVLLIKGDLILHLSQFVSGHLSDVQFIAKRTVESDLTAGLQ